MLDMFRRLLTGPKKIVTNKTVEVYTWRTCPYCWRAKSLLKRKGVKFREHAIDGDDEARAAMIERTGGPRSLPQIFIENVHIGGCDDLHAIETSGQLDQILTQEVAPS